MPVNNPNFAQMSLEEQPSVEQALPVAFTGLAGNIVCWPGAEYLSVAPCFFPKSWTEPGHQWDEVDKRHSRVTFECVLNAMRLHNGGSLQLIRLKRPKQHSL